MVRGHSAIDFGVAFLQALMKWKFAKGGRDASTLRNADASSLGLRQLRCPISAPPGTKKNGTYAFLKARQLAELGVSASKFDPRLDAP